MCEEWGICRNRSVWKGPMPLPPPKKKKNDKFNTQTERKKKKTIKLRGDTKKNKRSLRLLNSRNLQDNKCLKREICEWKWSTEAKHTFLKIYCAFAWRCREKTNMVDEMEDCRGKRIFDWTDTAKNKYLKMGTQKKIENSTKLLLDTV